MASFLSVRSAPAGAAETRAVERQKRPAYLVSAKLVVGARFGFVAFLFFGSLVFESHRWVVIIHAPCLAYAVLITIVRWPCPLTHMEQWLLGRAGIPVHSGEFLPDYVWSRFGLTGSEFPVATGLIVALLVYVIEPFRIREALT